MLPRLFAPLLHAPQCINHIADFAAPTCPYLIHAITDMNPSAISDAVATGRISADKAMQLQHLVKQNAKIQVRPAQRNQANNANPNKKTQTPPR